MQTKPVTRHEPPGYPTRSELLAEERVLGQNLPKAWKLGQGFASAVALLVASHLTGCSGDADTSATDAEAFRYPEPIVMEASAWIESIFDDGQWVMLGCIVIMPPAFLPEDDAMSVFDHESQ